MQILQIICTHGIVLRRMIYRFDCMMPRMFEDDCILFFRKIVVLLCVLWFNFFVHEFHALNLHFKLIIHAIQ